MLLVRKVEGPAETRAGQKVTYRVTQTALRQNDPFDALLSIGLGNYRERIATLREALLDLERRTIVGTSVFSGRFNDFVDAAGA